MKSLANAHPWVTLSVFLMSSACAVVPEDRQVRGCFYVSDDGRWVGDTISIAVEQVVLLDHVVYYPKHRHVRYDSTLCYNIELNGSNAFFVFMDKKVPIAKSRLEVTIIVNDRVFAFRENLLDAPFVLVSSYDLDSVPGDQPDSVVLRRHVVPFEFE